MAENKTPDYTVDYEDERFQNVETDKTNAINENNATYDGMIGDSDKYFNDQIAETERWGKEQADLQQEQTDFTIEGINQQKDRAEKDYKKEQSGAYADWQKQSNKYGANAEAMAAQGMTNTGYSESSQVQMYNTYQNRVATARESFMRATTEYDNMITQARLSNNAALAQIAHDTLAQKLELALSGFQYKNTLLLEKTRTNREIDQMYHQRWQDVLNQINTENSLAENVRQFGLNYQLSQDRLAEDKRQFQLNYNLNKRAQDRADAEFNFAKRKYADSQKSGGSSGGSSSGGSSKINRSSTNSKKSKGTSGSSISKEIERKTGAKGSPSGGNDLELDMKNILDLGYGPISEKRLNELVESGQVEEIERGGKLTFKRVGLGK